MATFAVLDKAFANADINVAYWYLNMNASNFLTIRNYLADLITGTTIPSNNSNDSLIIKDIRLN